MQEYDTIDRQIHWLSQVLAKANRTFVPAQKDDSHTNLYFDAAEERILGRWIAGPDGKLLLALNLQSLSFQWLDAELNILHEVSVLNSRMEQLEISVSEYPASLNMGTEAFFGPLHFEIPDYRIDELHRADFSEKGLKCWIYYRNLASTASEYLLDKLQLESEICIWPHHFDSGIYIQVKADLGLGFGLAMEDTMLGEAYFYMSGYGGESPISYQNLTQLSAGKWEIGEHWKGAVLPTNTISDSSHEEAARVVHLFIKETTAWFLNLKS